MQRDMDLVRKLLQWMEKQEHGRNTGWKIAIDGYTDEQIGYHVYLMHQAGLIIGADTTATDTKSPRWIPIMLTWDGHDFLSAVQDDTVWAAAKKEVLRPAVGATFTVLLEWLKVKALTGLGVA